MAHFTPTEQFVRRLTEYQSRLYAYLLAILGNPDAVGDVLQDTNVAIWRKAHEYVEGTDFWAWTSRIAHFEVLAYRKRCAHSRLVFDNDLLDDIADEIVHQTESMDGDLAALYRCMDRLSQLDRELIRGRYAVNGSVKQLAELRGKSVGAISQALYRIRGELADCIEQAKKSEDRR